MKLHPLLLLPILFLSACNFTLAADVTPPPNYIPPLPAPTLGALYPASAPDVNNGEKIYLEKCLPCHGSTGLGDGEQGKQLPVTVAPLGLPDFAQNAVPAAWYAKVTQGNIERYMPPFASLNDQERWDVVAYALTLHTNAQQIEKGKVLCDDCEKHFSDLKKMSALSEIDLIQIIKNGEGDIPAFGQNLSVEDLTSVAIYLRSQTFAALVNTPEQIPTSSAPTTPQADSASAGTASGRVENQSGADFPANTKITLRGYEHSADPATGASEVSKNETTLNADGSYQFDNVALTENRAYTAEIDLNGLFYQSDFVVAKTGDTQITLPAFTVYATTTDFSTLKISSLQIFFDFANAEAAQMFAVYSITNNGDKTILVDMGAEKIVPFILLPEGVKKNGYETAQDSADFVPTDNGFAMPPTEKAYSLIAFGSLQNKTEISISQPTLLPIDEVNLYLSEGITATGSALTDGGIQNVQGLNFHVYSAGKVAKGANLEFTLSGTPAATTAVNPDIFQNKNLLIGVGGFGLALIALGVWLFMRERNAPKTQEENEDDDEDDEFEDNESIMDAIIALDEQHRAGKLNDKAYQQRRDELKKKLR